MGVQNVPPSEKVGAGNRTFLTPKKRVYAEKSETIKKSSLRDLRDHKRGRRFVTPFELPALLFVCGKLFPKRNPRGTQEQNTNRRVQLECSSNEAQKQHFNKGRTKGKSKTNQERSKGERDSRVLDRPTLDYQRQQARDSLPQCGVSGVVNDPPICGCNANIILILGG